MRKNNTLIFFKLIILVNILFFFNSCNYKKDSNVFFIGGEIINPSSSDVNIYRNNIKIDSVELDDKNTFFKQINNVNSGIYRIEHLPEYQNILVDKGDSIWIRVNGEDFSESLSFTGKGSSKNNFLIDISNYLNNEDDFLSNMYSENSTRFKEIIDSLSLEKENIWNDFIKSGVQSKLSEKVTKSSILYSYANRLERYALLRGSNWNSSDAKKYFNYRNYLNLNDKDLILFEPYITYLMNYFNKSVLDSSQVYFYQKNNTDFNIKKLVLIDSEIKDNDLKNILSRATAVEELLNFKNHDYHERFIGYYSYINSSQTYYDEIIKLHNDINKMQSGKMLPEINLMNFNQDIISSLDAFNKNKTLIYFWSQTQMNHYRRTIRRVNELKEKFPEYRYVGICIQPYNYLVNQAQAILNVTIDNQFSFTNFESSSKDWVLTYLNKAIIIDRKSKIIDGFGNLFSNSIEESLSRY
tara:strand:- start:1887 stop:3290 length:1404 start_codon:yes stop_codon:yes gene_type:complete